MSETRTERAFKCWIPALAAEGYGSHDGELVARIDAFLTAPTSGATTDAHEADMREACALLREAAGALASLEARVRELEGER